jgi:hypothetical protein
VPDANFRQDFVNAATQEIGRLERKLDSIDLRIDAFKRQLPNADEAAAAEKERKVLVKRLDVSKERFRSTWSKLYDAMAALEPVANELTEAREEFMRTENRIKAHSRKFGIEADAPDSWKPSDTEAQVVYLRGLLLEQVAFGNRNRPTRSPGNRERSANARASGSCVLTSSERTGSEPCFWKGRRGDNLNLLLVRSLGLTRWVFSSPRVTRFPGLGRSFHRVPRCGCTSLTRGTRALQLAAI